MASLMSMASIALKSLLGIILILALIAVHDLGEQWAQEITDADVYTIQDPRYWSPMTMIVPNDCNVLKRNMAQHPGTSSSKGLLLMNEYELAETPEIRKNLLGHPIIASEDVMALVAVNKCNLTIEALDVTWSQYYWAAMITASSNFGIEDLHNTRLRFFWWFCFTTVCAFLFEYVVTCAKAAMPPQKEPLQQKVLQQVMSKLSTLTTQMTFVSLFITYWHEDHYLMNYFPGLAYIMLQMYTYGFLLLPLAAAKCPNDAPTLIQYYGICGCCLCCPVFLPIVLGWNLYNIQFLWTLFRGEYQDEVAFSAKFPSLQDTVGSASKHLIGINVVDAVMESVGEYAAMLREPEEEEGDLTGFILDGEPLLINDKL